MARVGRNDPCPCGSGKKYKACCFDRDSRRAGARLDNAARAAAGAAPAWQADVVPFPARFDSDPDARPGAVLVVGAGMILHSEILMRPSGEHGGVAAILEEAVPLSSPVTSGLSPKRRSSTSAPSPSGHRATAYRSRASRTFRPTTSGGRR